jgi:hypothetical protein
MKALSKLRDDRYCNARLLFSVPSVPSSSVNSVLILIFWKVARRPQ